MVIDDDFGVRSAVSLAFERDLDIYEASDGEEALREIALRNPDVIFLDLEFDGVCRGWDILDQIRKSGSKALILILTANSKEYKNPRLKNADGFFDKFDGFTPVRDYLVGKGLIKSREEPEPES